MGYPDILFMYVHTDLSYPLFVDMEMAVRCILEPK